MTAPVKVFDLGNNADVFAYGLACIENLGSCSRLTFYVPKTDVDGRVNNEVALLLIVPTDRVAGIAAMLSMPPTENIARKAKGDGDEESELTVH
jgi:hypothetical protein